MMLEYVGCYIQNDFYFKTYPQTNPSYQESSIRCGNSCFKNKDCTRGWSYQQATGTCLFIPDDIKMEDLDLLQPNSFIMDTNRTVGWTTGLKACHETATLATNTMGGEGPNDGIQIPVLIGCFNWSPGQNGGTPQQNGGTPQQNGGTPQQNVGTNIPTELYQQN